MFLWKVANAVGAALSKVSGTVDYVCSLAETPHEEAEREAERRAREKAIEAGADSCITRKCNTNQL